MTVSELLRAIRQPYADLLAKAAAQPAAYVEPAYRQADGTLATEGPLALPCRADIIPTEGESAGRPVMIDSVTQLEFDPFAFELDTAAVSIRPFVWDWAAIEADGLDARAAIDAFKAWFFAWFDADDENAPGEDGLHGIVHYLSEPARTEQGWRVNADLGSAPETAVEDLLFRLVDAGATRIVVA
ncbi:hypothetical protein WT77_03465 [Burkholderia stagnalis]|uniref:hypothetical protein n=1 Tax=Burkholderia stagnalis TaxID=1503054 RepID=UPI00075FE900|nr:hypothetical protein [Burkholderia stagnalis]KWK31846.1 hypothetical protein WT77_03465 [Burkholderia stagnalis]KWK41773.1 hypothetical protein WT80_25305 [Burkholderia stagnalis]KWK58374.1 hypothetical protein WT81_17700 [Burkholderia stagnalis]KWN70494.1 hypothetical protein WT90_21380 [Burkholderia stagnalis]